MNRRPIIQCSWNGSCACEFVDEQELSRHCIEHIEAKIAVARAQRKIRLPVETWTEVLGGCGPKSLEERVCFAQCLFHRIARTLLDGPRDRRLPRMAFTKAKADNSEVVLVKMVESGDSRLVELPIAEVAPPQNVTSFTQIRVKFFDANVLSFFRTVRPLLSNVWLTLAITERTFWDDCDQQKHYNWEGGSERHNLTVLECLLREFPNMDIIKLSIHDKSDLMSADLFARLLTNVRILRIQCQMPAPTSLSLFGVYSRHCSPYIPVLVKWLRTPAGDGQLKVAYLDFGNLDNLAVLVAQAKEHFLSANSFPAVPYFVALHSTAFDIASVQLPFATLHNHQSGEMLSLRRLNEPFVDDGHDNNIVLYRRKYASPLAPTEQNEEAQFLAMKQEFVRAVFPTEWCNILTLNVAQMDEIDETQFAGDEPIIRESSDTSAGENDDESGPSSAKKVKSQNGE